MRRIIVPLTLAFAALLAIGLAAPGLADDADLAGNGWGNGVVPVDQP